MENNDNKYFLEALKCAKESKDTTMVGAVIILNNEIVSTGYNRIPEGIDDDVMRYVKEVKSFYIEHAERTAIYNALLTGIKIYGATIYVNYFPCSDCARAIIQSGIKRIVTTKPDYSHYKWGKNWEIATEMLNEANIIVDFID